jgi:energy-coupling factor transport system substrate-specific component
MLKSDLKGGESCLKKLLDLTYVHRLLIAVLLMMTFFVLLLLLRGKHYLLFSFMCLLCSILPAYWRFEREPIRTKTLMFIGILIALAVAGRVPLAAIPSVQAASFIIIIGGISLGPELGFITGSTTALVSNMFLGQGPWTPWQMLAWGLMGLTAGLLGKTRIKKSLLLVVIFGGVWGFLFGWIMDLWYALAYVNPLNLKSFILAFGASVPFVALHAGANVLLLTFLYKPWELLFNRLVQKYQLLSK